MQSALRRLSLRPLVSVASDMRSSLLGQASWMSLWKSEAVRNWVDSQPDQTLYKAQYNPDHSNEYMAKKSMWSPPGLSRRLQAREIKKAIFAGDIKLEPTVMVPPTKFKGHKRQRMAPARLQLIQAKMASMPQQIAEYRQVRPAVIRNSRPNLLPSLFTPLVGMTLWLGNKGGSRKAKGRQPLQDQSIIPVFREGYRYSLFTLVWDVSLVYTHPPLPRLP